MKQLAQSTFILFALAFLLVGDIAYAGFGVTPPYVRNTSLTRNSVYEQQILLVRGDPNIPLQATVQIDAPEVYDWIEIIEGDSFELPQGQQKVPMTVRVTVPGNADFKSYTGAIRVKTSNPTGLAAGAVNISLGAQIDLNLTVIDREIKDFRVRKVDVPNLNEGHKVGWLYFPGKINFGMLIENIGNVDVSPSEVVFNIYDVTGKVLLEETTNKGRIEKTKPFETKEVNAKIPTRLPAGSYIARYKIMNDDTVVQEGNASLSILQYGTLQTAGFGFGGLSLPHKLSVMLPILALIALIIFLVYTIRERRQRPRSR